MPNLFNRFIKSTRLPAPPSLYPATRGGIGGGWSDGNMNTYPIAFPGYPDRTGIVTPAMRPAISMQSAWFFSDVRAIASTASVLEIQVKERSSDGADEELTDIANHPFEQLWRKPNDFMGRAFLTQYWTWQMHLYGEGYLFFAPRGGELAEIWPIPSAKIQPIGTADKFIDHYEYRVTPQTVPLSIDPEFVCYSRFVNPFDPRHGLAPTQAMALGLDSDLAMARSNLNYHGEGNATPTSVMSVPATTNDTDLVRIRDDLKTNFGRNQHKTMVVRAGDVSFDVIQFNYKDMMFDTLREMSRTEIDRCLGIPDGYWTAKANRANSEHADQVLVEAVVWPLGVMLAEDLNSQIVPLFYGENIEASFVDIREKNVQLELDSLKVKATFYTLAELRESNPPPAVTEVGVIKDAQGNPLWDDPRNIMFASELTPAKADTTTAAQPAAIVGAEKPPAALVKSLSIVDAEKGKWQTKALRRLKDGKPNAACNFDSETIPADEHHRIGLALAECKTIDDVRSVFGISRMAEAAYQYTKSRVNPLGMTSREVTDDALNALRESIDAAVIELKAGAE